MFSVVLDTFLSCKSWALQLKNTRSDDGVIGGYLVIFEVVSTSLDLTGHGVVFYYSSRYNFTKQKLAFLLYKITRSDGGGKLFSVVLDTFLSCKSWALQLKNTRSDGGVIAGYLVIWLFLELSRLRST